MRFLLLFVFMITSFTAHALNMDDFSRLPILHEGRVKPLDTFARVSLKTFYGKETFEELSATEWLAELLFDPDTAQARTIINIPNPDVVTALNLEWRNKHRYSFIEVATAIRENQTLVDKLLDLSREETTQTQEQLVELYYKTLWLFSVSRAVALVWPAFLVPDSALAQTLGVPANQPFTYLEMMQHKGAYIALMADLENKPAKDFTVTDAILFKLGEGLRQLTQTTQDHVFTIIPPQWEGEDKAWLTPWATFERGRGSPHTSAYLENWANMAAAWKNSDPTLWAQATQNAAKTVSAMHKNTSSARLLSLEVDYNKFNVFKLSLYFYGLAIVTLALFGFLQRRFFMKIALVLVGSGFVLHLAGIVLRMLIMNRPPVATLYESIVFSGLIVVLLSLVLESRRRDGIGLLMGSIGGFLLHFIALKFAAEGDSMGMLVAVLNTNFWLATHVVAITVGYGCSLMASSLGHLYLVQHFRGKSAAFLDPLMRNMLGICLIALLFTALGTILGGVWADQSWGRFWGWDPKENGALLIVLWLAWLLHGRIAGVLAPLGYAAGLALTNVVVAVAWFGVNLLNVGLHSYGFTKGLAQNLMLFCGVEVVFVLGIALVCWQKEKSCASS